MPLTSTQQTDMQADLGITADESVFTDDELDRLYERAGEDYNLAVYYGWRQLMADASKFFDYTAGMTTRKKSQVREHIGAMVEFWKEESRTAANQARILGLNQIPPRHKDEPDSFMRRRTRKELNNLG